MECIKYIDNTGEMKTLKTPIHKKRSPSRFQIIYTDFGIYMLLPVFFCTGAGYLADTYFREDSLFTLIGICIGGVLAINNLYILLNKKEDGPNRTPHQH